jgi:ABC-type sugar transport system ATPase subunit
MPSYRVENLTKTFGKTTALSGITLDAAAGEFVVVLGPTGAGKTTLLRTLTGLEKADGGKIFEDQTEISPLPPAERDMAMVFQNFSLYPRLTVYENLAFPLRPKWRAMDPKEIDRRVNWAAELLGITTKLKNLPTELSGGQQQRVAIGRAIVREPKLFLFDEPLASLDAKLRESMTVELHRLQRRLKTTMLYVTHDQLEAMGLADRIIVLDEGKILQAGPPEEIYNKPVSPRVARMLGSPPINLISAQEYGALFSGGVSGSVKTVGIRPEHLKVTRGGAAAKVKVVERLGATTTLFIESKNVELRASVGPTASFAPGEAVNVAIDAGHVLTWNA